MVGATEEEVWSLMLLLGIRDVLVGAEEASEWEGGEEEEFGALARGIRPAGRARILCRVVKSKGDGS